ncbi:MAG: glycosyltransferase family 2 protein [Ruminococcus sp.]|nr:glycosyltransferase family 2 protein [Ruminococcus sp.]
MNKIAVLIPCYNEAKTIEKVVKDFKKNLPNADIYVYDNNSSDKTSEIAEKAGAIVRHEYMQGKGNVIRRMFREIDADCYIMTDGDDTYPAEHAKEMCDLILEGKAEMVVGDRLSSTYFTENKRMFHNFGNVLVRFLVNKTFKSNVRDIMTGYRAFSKTFVKSFPVISGGFEIETEMTIHALDKKMKLENVLIDYRDRPEGSVSKLNTVSDGIKVLKTIASLFKQYRPFTFFTILSIICLLIGVGFFIPSLVGYINSGLVEKFPSLIAASFFGIISIQLFVGGLILESIARKDRQNFELHLINLEQSKK